MIFFLLFYSSSIENLSSVFGFFNTFCLLADPYMYTKRTFVTKDPAPV